MESCIDILAALTPVAGAMRFGRKSHKEAFEAVSVVYEKKVSQLEAQLRQVRMDVFGEKQVFICPQGWDADFWQKRLEVFVKEHYETKPSARELLLDFIQLCIETFPKGRLEATLKGLETVQKVIRADQKELVNISHDDVQLAIDFLSFYKDVGEVKKMKEELVALLPSTKGCNFLVLGMTGVGKSSLLNSLLGDNRFETGTGKPVTTKGIHESEGVLDGLKVRVFDSWGLEAGATEEWMRMLEDAQEKHDVQHKVEDWFHAVVYCVNAGGHRIQPIDRDIIRNLLQEDLYVVVALTQSDLCSEADAQKLREALTDKKNGCEKLKPENVIETCTGGKTRSGKSESFGIPDLKRAILTNYKRTIQKQLPSRCIYLAEKKVNAFEEETEKWIRSRDWKYNENENNHPLSLKCDKFAKEFTHEIFPMIVREEITACSEYGRNLATVLQLDHIEDLVPDVPQDPTFWGKVGNFFVKTFKFLNPFGKSDTKEEQERLRCKLEDFCKGILAQVEQQRDAIERKVREVMR